MKGPSSIVVPVQAGSRWGWAEPPLPPCDPQREQFLRAQIDLDNMCESLWRQVQAVWETGAKPTDILLGRDFWGHFLRDCHEKVRYFEFTVPKDYGPPVYPDTFKAVFAGLRVHCIPWMEGVVVTPALSSLAPRPRSTNDWTVQMDKWAVTVPAVGVPQTKAPPGLVKEVLQSLRQSFNEWLDRPKPFVRPGRRWKKP